MTVVEPDAKGIDSTVSQFVTDQLVGALLDRLTHHIPMLEMNSESYSLAKSKKSLDWLLERNGTWPEQESYWDCGVTVLSIDGRVCALSQRLNTRRYPKLSENVAFRQTGVRLG